MGNNDKTSGVTFNTILRAKAFREGVADYKASLPFRNYEDDVAKDYYYEWGRQFAALFPEWSVKRLRPAYGKVDNKAVNQFTRAYLKGWIGQ